MTKMQAAKLSVTGIALITLLASVLAGCAQTAPLPTPTPSPKPTVASTPTPTPTAAAKPTASPAPTPTTSIPPTPTATLKLPEGLTAGALQVGSRTHAMATMIGEAIKKKYGVDMKVVPYGTGQEVEASIRSGKVQFDFGSSDGWQASEGVFTYAAWGPQKVSLIWQPPGFFCGTAVTKASGIKTAADLKGKRVAQITGYTIVSKWLEATLAYGGLTLKDVTVVNAPSYTAGIQALLDGRVDAAPGAPSTDKFQELAAAPAGLSWVPLSFNNEDGWKRVRETFFIFDKGLATIGAEVSKEKPVEMLVYPAPLLVTYSNVSDDVAYFLAKALNETYDMYKGGHTDFIYYSMKVAVPPYGGAPYNVGAVRYFKEVGVWTPAHEEFQKQALKRQDVLSKAWEQATLDAKAKQIPEKDFADFWLQARSDAYKAAGIDQRTYGK